MICGVITAMPVLYMAVAVVLKQTEVLTATGMGNLDPVSGLPITLAVVVLGTLSSTASILVKVLLLRSFPVQDRTPDVRFKATLITMAVSESGAVMGLTLILITGSLLYGGLLCGLSFAVTCFHFPSRYWLESGDSVL
jgi:hypothetical protein